MSLRDKEHVASVLSARCPDQVPEPMLALLAAVASGQRAALEANAYLAQLPAVAQLLLASDARLRQVAGDVGGGGAPGEPHLVEAAEALPLLGAAYSVPQVPRLAYVVLLQRSACASPLR